MLQLGVFLNKDKTDQSGDELHEGRICFLYKLEIWQSGPALGDTGPMLFPKKPAALLCVRPDMLTVKFKFFLFFFLSHKHFNTYFYPLIITVNTVVATYKLWINCLNRRNFASLQSATIIRLKARSSNHPYGRSSSLSHGLSSYVY